MPEPTDPGPQTYHNSPAAKPNYGEKVYPDSGAPDWPERGASLRYSHHQSVPKRDSDLRPPVEHPPPQLRPPQGLMNKCDVLPPIGQSPSRRPGAAADQTQGSSKAPGSGRIHAEIHTAHDDDHQQQQHEAVTPASRQIFEALDTEGTDTVSSHYLTSFLRNNGILEDDPRLADFYSYLEEGLGATSSCDRALDIDQFARAISSCSTIVNRTVKGELRVPDMPGVAEVIQQVYDTVLPDKRGANASYIPQLAKVDPDQFAISITTVDGQRFSVGDDDRQFCVQACSQPISYLIGVKQYGPEYVHRHVGKEPSGGSFNDMGLKEAPTADNPGRAIPHNPCINSGAIMMVGMVYPEKGDGDDTSSDEEDDGSVSESDAATVPVGALRTGPTGLVDRAQRLEMVLNVWRELSRGPDGANPIQYDEATYKSESATADRNWCLAYMMRRQGSYPPCFVDHDGSKLALEDTLELYFQICAIQSTNKGMSVMAATLANGGLNPLSGHRVFQPHHVRCILPLMLTCGMYDFSGSWIFEVGIPAKSGVGGCIYMVIPNVCGISVWSPRLDDGSNGMGNGNSIRAVMAAQELSRRITLGNFDVHSGLNDSKMGITTRRDAERQAEILELLYAASEGDITSLEWQEHAGTDVTISDYDGRTALHLAAAEGHAACCSFLMKSILRRAAHKPAPGEGGGVGGSVRLKAKRDLSSMEVQALLSSRDRWGGTPLSDAVGHAHADCVELLSKAGAAKGNDTTGLNRQSVYGVKSDDGGLEAEVFAASGNGITVCDSATQLLYACSKDDLDMLVRMRASGADLLVCDYDQRTAMHLAASTGSIACLKYLIVVTKREGRMKEMFNVRDRFGNKPVDDSTREGHADCTAALEAAFQYAVSEIQIPVESKASPTGSQKVSPTYRRAGRRKSESGFIISPREPNQKAGGGSKAGPLN